MSGTVVAAESVNQADVLDLLRLSDEYALALYPAENCYLLDAAELDVPGVRVFVARTDGTAVGVAALVDRGDGSAELKRMFVRDSARGRGIARALLAAVDEVARGSGIRTLQLETGTRQPAAIALYRSDGFEVIPNFGDYAGDEFSVCLEKRLT